MKCRFQVGMLQIMSVSSRYLPHVGRAKARYIEVSCCGKVFLHQVKRVKLRSSFSEVSKVVNSSHNGWWNTSSMLRCRTFVGSHFFWGANSSHCSPRSGTEPWDSRIWSCIASLCSRCRVGRGDAPIDGQNLGNQLGWVRASVDS